MAGSGTREKRSKNRKKIKGEKKREGGGGYSSSLIRKTPSPRFSKIGTQYDQKSPYRGRI